VGKVTITLVDNADQTVTTLFHFEGGYNDESRAHVMAAMAQSHWEKTAEELSDRIPVLLREVDGHMEIAQPS